MTPPGQLSTPHTNHDWDAIYDRIKQATERLDASLTLSPGQRQAILKKRAEAIARPDKKEEDRELIEVVLFRLALETYAVECSFIREVYPLKELTPLPGLPDFILGIVNVRGEIISVIDIKRFFQMPLKGLTDLTRVIILRHPVSGMEFGILAEEVIGTINISKRSIQSPQETLPTLTGIRTDYLKGVTPAHIIVLFAEKLLADIKMVIHQEVELS